MTRLPARIQDLLMPEPNSGCWLFVGTWTTGNGYGKTYWRGAHRVLHRVVYEILMGEIAPGLVLDHTCRVRACSNPDHLEPVTQQVNTLRGNAVLFRPAGAYSF